MKHIRRKIPYRFRAAYLALINRQVGNHREPEPGVLMIARKYVTKDDYVVEIGARYGASAYFLSLLAKHVHAFEPDKRCRYQLAQLAAGSGNITPVFTALGDRQSEAGLTDKYGCPTIDTNGKGISVEKLTSWQPFPTPAVLFCDCEGSETSVLKGADLNNFRLLAIETHKFGNIDTYAEVERHLSQNGFVTESVQASAHELWVTGLRK